MKYSLVIKISLIIGAISLIVNFLYGLQIKNGTMFDESLVSALAFFLLILTALMQNTDLKIQKKEMANNTQALIEQQQELKENNIQFKFFRTIETMNKIKADLNIMYKEVEYFSDYTDPGKSTYNINLNKFNHIERVIKSEVKHRFIHDRPSYYSRTNTNVKIYQYYINAIKELKNSINTIDVDMCVLRSLIDFDPIDTKEMEKEINSNINKKVEKILSKNNIKNEFYVLFNLHRFILEITEDTKNSENSLRVLYMSTLTESEKTVYRFLGGEASINDFYEKYRNELVLKSEE
ncbi:hypothetical protein [Staphylococcus haemolyticus]|uniref:hypothetical protein n=1 Tax=Staphylococcus haemolyticus TaxID=1283 RepID=UPI0023A91AA8|nr:hypothetical protein [Staphylococcus haemolyticus]WEB18306.1 hypothetical protein PUW68_00265 [Staphylococcus haemolyticus]